MPGYSISQIFESKIPHQGDTMFSAMQPSRPKISPQSHPSQTPVNQQPTRAIASSSTPQSISTPTYTYTPPRTQIEAMPPLSLPLPLPLQAPRPMLVPVQVTAASSSGLVRLDSTIRHPVFFTDRLKKAPTGVRAGEGNWSSPVAVGYVYNDGARRCTVGGVNL